MNWNLTMRNGHRGCRTIRKLEIFDRLPTVLLLALSIALIAATCSHPAHAQPGDLARSLVAEVGVVGELGEPQREGGFAHGLCQRMRPQDEVWVISTRHLEWPTCEDDPPPLKVWQWSCPRGRWQKLSVDYFLEQHNQPITFFFFHGNRINSWAAVDLGWYAYDALVARAADEQPIRYVIWSWPSTEIQGQLRDLRYKADRTDAEGYYLGWLLSKVNPGTKISLMGFSYGARVITGGLHVAAGGDLCGMSLPPDAPAVERRTRTVLMAGALHSHWLYPDCYHGRAMDATDRLCNLCNGCDSILHRYHWVFKGQRPDALGYTGLPWQHESGRIDEFETCNCVGKTHDSLMYLDCPTLVELSQKYVFWQEFEGREANSR